MVYTVEKTLSDAGDKIDEKTRKDIQSIAADMKKAISDKDLARIDELSEKLSKQIQEVGAKMYQSQTPPPNEGEQQSEQQPGQEAGPDPGQDDEKVVDADFKDK